MEEIYPCPELAGSLAAAANRSKQKHWCVIASSRLVTFPLSRTQSGSTCTDNAHRFPCARLLQANVVSPLSSPTTVHTEEGSTSPQQGTPRAAAIVLLLPFCSGNIFNHIPLLPEHPHQFRLDTSYLGSARKGRKSCRTS